MFSSRLRQGLGRNRLARALEQRLGSGLPVFDLTLSNPTLASFDYPGNLGRSLAGRGARAYEPRPFGLPAARQAVSEDFTRRRIAVPAERIVLTASTSEAYSLLFKLLCDPGDAVLAPRPSYPLVEHLSELDGVRLEPYSLEYHGHWSIDIDGLRRRLTGVTANAKRVRAIIVISPNNPTGSIAKTGELKALAVLAREHDLALIADEVFADYSLDGEPPASVLAHSEALAFGLGGLSKTVGLPQVKLGWIGVNGPQTLVEEALERLETICDMYLSVSTPVQVAAPALLKSGAIVRTQIQRRIRRNYRRLRAVAGRHPSCTVLPAEAGWYAVVQVPAIESEEAMVVELLETTGILVHPGHFFDFEREAFIVVSLLPEQTFFSSTIAAMFAALGRPS